MASLAAAGEAELAVEPDDPGSDVDADAAAEPELLVVPDDPPSAGDEEFGAAGSADAPTPADAWETPGAEPFGAALSEGLEPPQRR